MSLTPEQLERRKSGLGGSEVATILNLNPYKSPYQLWLEKTGRVEPEDISDRFAVKRGNDMEALVAKWFSEETGETVHRVNATLTNDEHPYLLGHIDRRIVGKKEGLECKTANWRMAAKFGDSGTDDVPPYYLIQCVHYMIVTGYRVWHLAADLGGEFRIYRIEYDEELANHVARTAHEWWERHIVNDEPPEATDPADLDLQYPHGDPDVAVEALSDVKMLHEELCSLQDALKELKDNDAAIRAKMKAAMGEATALVFEGRNLATWRSQKRRSFNSKSFKADYPDLHAEYTNENESRYFRVNYK